MDKQDLINRYFQICNEALQANKDKAPFKHILQAAQTQNALKDVGIAVIEDHPTSQFIMHLNGDKIEVETNESCHQCQCKAQWRVPKSYLENVIRNPEEYIKNPAKIDWEWLQSAGADVSS